MLLENAVFIELMRRGRVPNLSLFYARTKNGYEIDFLLPDYPTEAALIQVACSLRQRSTLERELRALEQGAKEFRVAKMQIVTLHEEATYKVGSDTVSAIPFWKWCQGD